MLYLFFGGGGGHERGSSAIPARGNLTTFFDWIFVFFFRPIFPERIFNSGSAFTFARARSVVVALRKDERERERERRLC